MLQFEFFLSEMGFFVKTKESIFHHYILTKFSFCSLIFFCPRWVFSSKQKNLFFHHYILTEFSCCSLIFLVIDVMNSVYSCLFLLFGSLSVFWFTFSFFVKTLQHEFQSIFFREIAMYSVYSCLLLFTQVNQVIIHST